MRAHYQKKRPLKREMLLYGKNSVADRLRYNPSTIRRVYLSERFSDTAIVSELRTRRIPVTEVSSARLSRMKKAKNLQGIIAAVEPFFYSDFDAVLTAEPKRVLIILDRIWDPRNLGAIIRSCACLGGFAILMPEKDSCGITEAVLHVASGGENFVPIVRVANLSRAVRRAKDEAGYWIVGALSGGKESLDTFSFTYPLGIVLGSEGSDIRKGLEKLCDWCIRIPMQEQDMSLNVTTACSLFCYEANKQKSFYATEKRHRKNCDVSG